MANLIVRAKTDPGSTTRCLKRPVGPRGGAGRGVADIERACAGCCPNVLNGDRPAPHDQREVDSLGRVDRGFFDRIVWGDFGLEVNGLTFRARGDHAHDAWRDSENFLLYKSPAGISLYDNLWRRFPRFDPKNVVELGVWEGGSVAFWFEWLQPKKHVAIDLLERSNSAHFRQYVEERAPRGEICTRWGVSQDDRGRVLEIVGQEFGPVPVDLVIDDASHDLDPTRVSFETLFPLLSPGGLYIIEDWNWEFAPQHSPEKSKWARRHTPPTDLVHDFVSHVGSGDFQVSSVTLLGNLAAVEHG
jgi:cephalosporin hydroxylase